jgi:hypothetical protein
METAQMDEQAWLTCANPDELLEFLRERITERKLRLFMLACCWRVPELLDPLSKKLLKVAARYTDGAAEAAELREAHRALVERSNQLQPISVAARETGRQQIQIDDGMWVASRMRQAVAWRAKDADQAKKIANPGAWMAAAKREQGWQAMMVRDLFGNAFRPVERDPAWQTRGDPPRSEHLRREALRGVTDPRRCIGGGRLPQRRSPHSLPRTRRTHPRLLGA